MSMIDDAATVAALFSVDPVGTGGVCVHSQVHPAREQWLGLLEYLLPANSPLKRMPCNISDSRLLGGLDLTATLKANRPVAEQGILASSDGGVVVVRMAERLSAHTSAALGAVMDAGEVVLLREAVSGHLPARLGIVAMDEGIGVDEAVPRSLMDRLAFILDFDGLSTRATIVPSHDAEQILAARALLPQVWLDDDIVERLWHGAGARRRLVTGVCIGHPRRSCRGSARRPYPHHGSGCDSGGQTGARTARHAGAPESIAAGR
jgi:magnesium chelatase subunit D